MSETRFHKAAKDGYTELLRLATKLDANKADENGMTPTLYAAFKCNLDALRVLISRGGDPDKPDLFGSTALHFASTCGDMNCCSFLVSFGANVFALDNDMHTPLDVAALHEHVEIVRFLDATITKLSLQSPQSVKKRREKEAVKARERIKKFDKVAAKAQKRAEAEEKKSASIGVAQGRKQRKNSSSSVHGTTTPSPSTRSASLTSSQFSAITAQRSHKPGAAGRIEKKRRDNEDFKVSQRDAAGKLSMRSLIGVRHGSDVLYVQNPGTSRQGPVAESKAPKELQKLFSTPGTTLGRGNSVPNLDEMGKDSVKGIFNIPGWGERFFPKNPSQVLSLPPAQQSTEDPQTNADESDAHLPWEPNTILDEDLASSPLQTFLACCSMTQYLSAFNAECIGLDALMLCTENDLQAAGIPLGPRKVIIDAVKRRQKTLAYPGPMRDVGL